MRIWGFAIDGSVHAMNSAFSATSTPWRTRAEILRSGIECRIAHRSRLLAQAVGGIDLGIAGGYHCGNLGDMALGEAIRLHAVEHFRKPGLQTIYDLQRWPRARSLIVGGGAVAYAGPLAAIASRYRDAPGRVAMFGVDFNDPDALARHKDFYSQVRLLGCRSSGQADMLRALLPGAAIDWTYDLVFSLHRTPHARDAAAIPPSRRDKVFGINMVPFFVKHDSGRFMPGTAYAGELQRERPGMLAHIDELAGAYPRWMRRAVQEMLDAGYRVVHFPFTPTDDTYARYCLQGLEVSFRRYDHAPLSVLQALGRCRAFLSSRYHSLIFSLITATPVVAFEYASKCSRLLDDLGEDSPSRRNWDDLLGECAPAVVGAAEGTPLLVEPARLSAMSGTLVKRIDAVLAALGAAA